MSDIINEVIAEGEKIVEAIAPEAQALIDAAKAEAEKLAESITPETQALIDAAKAEAEKLKEELEPTLETAVNLWQDYGHKIDDLADWMKRNAPHVYGTFEDAKTALENEIKKITG